MDEAEQLELVELEPNELAAHALLLSEMWQLVEDLCDHGTVAARAQLLRRLELWADEIHRSAEPSVEGDPPATV